MKDFHLGPPSDPLQGMSDKEFLAYMAQKARDWGDAGGERIVYFMSWEDFCFAMNHGLCTVLVHNKPEIVDGHTLYRQLIRIEGTCWATVNSRKFGH